MMGHEVGILVVDDEPSVRDVLTALLEDEGYLVRTASNGREALATLRTWQPALILLDLMMPGMDGLAFRTAQRGEGLHLQVPTVVLSAARDAQSQATQIGAVAVIPKPFDVDVLLTVVERVVSQSATSD